MNKYNKHYLKRNPATGEILVEDEKPVLGELAKSDCPLEVRHATILNKDWRTTGIFYAIVENKPIKKAEKSEARLALESEANDLGVSFRDNIGDDKLLEKINKAKEV